MNKTIPSISIESLEVIKRLASTAVGDVVSYDELSKLAMGDIRNEKRHALQTAQNHLMDEKQMVFETIRNVGVKRAADVEIVEHSDSYIERIRRVSKRAMKRLVCVDYDKLPNESKVQHNARMSLLGALHHISAPGKLKQVESAVGKTNTRLNLAETLESFKGK